MATTIHPYRGYLNTPFNFYVHGLEKVTYKIFKEGEENVIKEGNILPNIPFSLKLENPGNYIIHFNDGTDPITINVIDGYKFGGSSLKNAFVFDDCSWLFIVMQDRTYFYNRESKENYLECVSPDKITLVNNQHIIFEFQGIAEKTIYSLESQKPILNISNILFFDNEAIVWEEEDEKRTIKVYSFLNQEIKITEEIDFFSIDKDNKNIICYGCGKLFLIQLKDNFEKKYFNKFYKGEIVDIQTPYLLISYEGRTSDTVMYFYDIKSQSLIEKKYIEGHLALINEKRVINISNREKAIKDFDLSNSPFPEAFITAHYFEIHTYPCAWDILYTIRQIKILKDNPCRIQKDESITLHSIKKELNQTLEYGFEEVILTENYICLYNNKESYVENKDSSGSGYKNEGRIYISGDNAYLYANKILFKLNNYAYWTPRGKEHDYNFSDFYEFGVIKNNETEVYQTLGGWELGKKEGICKIREPYLYTDKYFVFSGARKFKKDKISLPNYLSYNLKYGISVKDEGVFLYVLQDNEYYSEKILTELFDNTKYRNVLLSEDGNQIVFRDSQKTSLLNVETGGTIEFSNQYYVQQFNGIRPYFKIDEDNRENTRKVEIINPTTGKLIPSNILKDYVFISPDYQFYADNNLSAYEYYFDWLTEKDISIEDGNKIKKKLAWQYPFTIENPRNQQILENRKKYIDNNYSKFINRAKNHHWSRESEEKIISVFTNKHNTSSYNNDEFFELILEKRGHVIIKKIENNTEVDRIKLGPALWFLNYVSFSFDGRYVCIGGRYPNSSQYGGLFLIYDNFERKILYKMTKTCAIWNTAFNCEGMVVGYSSDPNLYFMTSEVEYKKGPNEIKQRSFLTFSPDGKYIALSNKGYISKNKRDGSIRHSWGHSKTTNVYIHKTKDIEKDIIMFNDLSQEGIAGASGLDYSKKESVASVSFSNDNKRLMMVGNDGVVIIRNLHLEEDADE